MLDINDVNVGDIIIINSKWNPTPVIGKYDGSVLIEVEALVDDSRRSVTGFAVSEKSVANFTLDFDIDISGYMGKRLAWRYLSAYPNAALVPKEHLKENKLTSSKIVGNSFYEICLQEAKQKIKKEDEQRPAGSAFEFL